MVKHKITQNKKQISKLSKKKSPRIGGSSTFQVTNVITPSKLSSISNSNQKFFSSHRDSYLTEKISVLQQISEYIILEISLIDQFCLLNSALPPDCEKNKDNVIQLSSFGFSIASRFPQNEKFPVVEKFYSQMYRIAYKFKNVNIGPWKEFSSIIEYHLGEYKKQLAK